MAGKKEETKVVEETTPQIDIQAMLEEALKKQKEELTKAFEEKLEKTVQGSKAPTEGTSDEDFNLNAKIKVQNIDHSIINCRTGAGKHVTWTNNGDIRLMTVQDIFDVIGSPSQSLFTDPCLKVLDEKLVEHLELTDLYKTIAKTENLESFVKLGADKIKGILDKLPEGYKRGLADEVYLMNEINPDFIDSGVIKRLLQKELHVDLGLKTV